jgi:hypothetical protein
VKDLLAYLIEGRFLDSTHWIAHYFYCTCVWRLNKTRCLFCNNTKWERWGGISHAACNCMW